MKQNLVSVIIPVYNAEKFIVRCLESIINQTYKNIEIIVINDGSTDNSSNILKKYEKKYNNIQVIEKENSGVSDTRNIGIINSKGKYIIFIDADDYIEKDYVEILTKNIIKSNATMLISNNEIILKDEQLEFIDITYPTVISDFLLTTKYNSCWGKIYNRKFIIENSIKFNSNIKYGEDMLFVLECYTKSKKTIFTNYHGYIYFDNPNSAMHIKSEKSIKKYYMDNLLTTKIICNNFDLDKNQINMINYKTLYIFCNLTYSLVIHEKNYKNSKKIMKEERKKYDEIFTEYNFKKYGNFKYNIYIWLLKRKFFYIYYLLIKIKLTTKNT